MKNVKIKYLKYLVFFGAICYINKIGITEKSDGKR